MSDWKAKRFWTDATVADADGGYQVMLDGRQLRTPAKSLLLLPTPALAEAIAVEWRTQEDEIDPGTMPLTRTANSAVDKVALQFDAVAEIVAEYGQSDLICYRAKTPEELIAQQAAAWDPLIRWAAKEYQAPLTPTAGVMHVAQPATSVENLRAVVFAQDAFSLAALHDLVAISGSLVIGLAAIQGASGIEDLWAASRVDEDWQISQWGEDDEATQVSATKKQAFSTALQFFQLSRA